MSDRTETDTFVKVTRPQGASSVVFVCEHASNHIPQVFGTLGLSSQALQSHVAWDPGALGVAEALSSNLDATLVSSRVSRLIYDINRPPDAPDAMPMESEVFDIPGNANLSEGERQDRISRYYLPFQNALEAQMSARDAPILITIHSFTPVYNGVTREVEVGVLHDTDARLADRFIETATHHTDLRVRRNEPYGPGDGVMHTLRKHAITAGHRNVMLEIRNDLILTPAAQQEMAAMLTSWTRDALSLAEVTP